MNQTHQTYTEKLYVGQYVNAPRIGLGRIKELGDGQAIVQSIITEQQVILTLEQVELLKSDLIRTTLRNALQLLGEMPDGYTFSVQIKNPKEEIIFNESYTGGENDRISNS